jgi:hypothetical protein
MRTAFVSFLGGPLFLGGNRGVGWVDLAPVFPAGTKPRRYSIQVSAMVDLIRGLSCSEVKHAYDISATASSGQ